MINEGSGFPLKYQYNKVHNLKLAAKKIDGLLIRPGETFSFWKAAKDADRDAPYLDGLSLVNGKSRRVREAFASSATCYTISSSTRR